MQYVTWLTALDCFSVLFNLGPQNTECGLSTFIGNVELSDKYCICNTHRDPRLQAWGSTITLKIDQEDLFRQSWCLHQLNNATKQSQVQIYLSQIWSVSCRYWVSQAVAGVRLGFVRFRSLAIFSLFGFDLVPYHIWVSNRFVFWCSTLRILLSVHPY